MENNEVINVSYEVALNVAKTRDERIARAAWKGKNWVALSGPEGNVLKAEGFWNRHSRKLAEDLGGQAIVQPYFIFKTEDSQIVMGWTPSQRDMLSNDWYVVVD
jgi:hypothetical protein